MHAHLDHDSCMEVTILRGKTDEVQHFAEHVIAERGVRHGRIVLVPTDVLIKPHTHADGHARHDASPPAPGRQAAQARRPAARCAATGRQSAPATGLAEDGFGLVRGFSINRSYPSMMFRPERHAGLARCYEVPCRTRSCGPSTMAPPICAARSSAIYVLLIAANVAAWAWALIAFHDHPVLLGTCFLAYSFGLRHAVDADHIAAIDNVTRKLMQEGKRPLAVGLFFSLGHSTVVVLATDRGRADGGRLQGPARRVPRHRRHDRHLGVGRLPADHRGDQRRHPGQRLRDVPARQARRRLRRPRTST